MSSRRAGVAMPVVLGVLVFLGLLVGSILLQTLRNRKLTALDQQKSQERLLVASALSLVQSEASRDTAFGREEWQSLRVFPGNRAGYLVRVRPWGLFLKAHVSVWATAHDTERVTFLLGGYRSAPASPTLVLLEPGGLRLFPAARLAGPLWVQGLIEGNHAGTPRPDLWPQGGRWILDTSVVDGWLDTARARFSAHSHIGDEEAPFQDRDHNEHLRGRQIPGLELHCHGTLFLRDVELDGALIFADRIVAEGRSRIDGSILVATHSMSLDGILQTTSQFLALDSLEARADSIQGNGLFYVQGALDTSFAPAAAGISRSDLALDCRAGFGLAFWRARGVLDRQAHFRSSRRTSWDGTWISLGTVSPKGALRGLLLARSVVRLDPVHAPVEGGMDSFELSPQRREWIALPWTPQRNGLWVNHVQQHP